MLSAVGGSEDEYELLKRITINEENEGVATIKEEFGNLEAVYVICVLPKRGANQNIYLRSYLTNGELICGGMATTYSSENRVRLKHRRVAGIWDAESEIGPATTAGTKCGQFGGQMFTVENNSFINKIDIYTFPDSVSSGYIKGTTFDIYGVRANA